MYVKEITEKYPKELLFNREMIEGNVIGLLWKNLDTLSEFKEIKSDWFITQDARLYFYIVDGMKKQGYTLIDEISLATFLQNEPTIKKLFDERGGYRTINNLSVLLNKDNFFKYHDELIKWNILLALYEKGFNVVKDLEGFKKATSSQVYEHYDLMLNNLFIKKTLINTEISDFKVGIKDYLEEADKGLA